MQKGPLSNAYEFKSLKYKLAYHAFNLLDALSEEETKALAKEFGATESELFNAIEELYTENADPDVEN